MTEDQTRDLKAKLMQEARKKFPGDKDRQAAYAYGTLREQGWKPEKEK